jgi:hypothetical protein
VRFCRSAGSGGGGLPSTELVVRIRPRWHDNQGPTAALENALDIVRAYLGGRSERSRGVAAYEARRKGRRESPSALSAGKRAENAGKRGLGQRPLAAGKPLQISQTSVAEPHA